MLYIVLGMHKSGTTLISRILHASGITMGCFDEAIDYDAGNQYERKETLELNLEMLGKGYEDFSLDVIEPKNKVGDASIKEKIAALIRQIGNEYEMWGFKDPRTCLTYEVWAGLLPEHKLIIVYRSPREIWYHYTKKINRWRLLKTLRRGLKALRAWYVYNCQIVEIVNRTQNEFIMFDYADFMNSNIGFKLMEDFVGKNLVDARQKKLYRAKGNDNWLFRLAKKICLFRFAIDVDGLHSELGRISKSKLVS